MGKKISEALFVWGIAAVLTACGQEAAPAGNLAKDISIDSGSQKETGKDEDIRKNGDETSSQENLNEKKGVFSFVYEGTVLTPGTLVDQDSLPKYTSVAEVPSCAFGGNDNVYHFDTFELTTYFDEKEERVYSVYFIDPNLPTTEGLCLGDTVDDMKSLYGENYEEKGTACIYTRGETMLNIILNNDIVVSIEYCLNLE